MSAEPQKAFYPATPAEAMGPLVRDKVVVAGRPFFISRPARSDHLVDHPAVRAAYQADEYLPYWTDLWPAARMLAKVVLLEKWTPGQNVLEIGCGLGLPGIAALARGLRVTFSDCDETALQFAAGNAGANGFDNFDVLRLDWRDPPQLARFPILLASDLVYELRNINPLVALIKQVLLPGGLCLLTDQHRLPAYNLQEALQGEGVRFTTEPVRAGEPGGSRVKGILYRITLPG